MAKFSNRITDVTYTLASATSRGLVGIGAQTFAGAKTFNDNIGIGIAPSKPLHVALGGTTPTSLSGSAVGVFQNSAAAGNASVVSIIGGNTGTAQLRLGDNDSDDGMRFSYDNNTSTLSMRIAGTNYGNLSASGWDFLSSSLTTSGQLTAGNGQFGGASGSFNLNLQSSVYSSFNFTDAANAIEGQIQYEHSSDKFYITAGVQADSTVDMTIQGSNGYVGIGATGPSRPLTVFKNTGTSGTPVASFSNNSSGDGYIQIGNNTQNWYIGADAAQNEALTFTANNATLTSAGRKMSLTVGGNLVMGNADSDNRFTIDIKNQDLGGGTFKAGGLCIGSSGSGYTHAGYNVRRTGTNNTWQYELNDRSSFIHFQTGGFDFYTSNNVTGTAGNAISTIQPLSISATGKVNLQDAATTAVVNFRGTGQTATTATSGGNTLPSNPAGFLKIQINGVDVRVPYYNV